MSEFLNFAVLGLGAGAIYAIAGIGMVQIYRGSGVLNFAHGAMALLSATLLVKTWTQWDWPLALAMPVSILAATLVGALVQLLVMNPLRDAAPLVRIIATLGVFAIIQQGVALAFGSQLTFETFVGSYYPSGALELFGDVGVSYDRLILLGIAIAIAVGLWLVMSRTRFGLATAAVAESGEVAESLGVSPGRVATLNWAIGATLAGLAGVLIVPISGLTTVAILLLMVPALAASMIGRFRSFMLVVLAGVGIGVAQSLLTRYQTDFLPHDLARGWPEALPFMLIILILALQGTPFPRRDEIAARLPRVGRRVLSPTAATLVALAACAVALIASEDLADSITTTALLAIVGLSLVVVTGLAGQISLAQLALAGLGALVAARLNDAYGWSFPLVLVVGVLAGCIFGALFGLVALRTRGPTLAVATVGLGLFIEKVVLNNRWITAGGFSGTPVERPTILGIEVDSITHPQRYAALAGIALVAVGFAVANLRGGPVGRRLLAVRNNERAAASLGMSVADCKLRAFAISAGIASCGGILMAFRFDSVNYANFSLFESLQLVIFSLIGGIGYVLGPVIGAVLSPSGFLSWVVADIADLERWLIIMSGVVLIVVLIAYPDGLARVLDRGRSRGRSAPFGRPSTESKTDGLARRETASLEVVGLSVRYGTVTAVHELDVTVDPGQIVGLIGPNGAGKTSAIDAISGFVPASGEVRLGDRDLSELSVHRRARSGLGRSFQTVELFEDLTIGENVASATDRLRMSDWLLGFVRAPRVAFDSSTKEIIEAFGLVDHLGDPPDSLPQGKRRLLGVARAMAAQPAVLLLDEPAAGLDGNETHQLGDLLRTLAREWGVGMLLVEHDVGLVTSISDHVIALDYGAQIFSGPPGAALQDARIRSAYLGDLAPTQEAVLP